MPPNCTRQNPPPDCSIKGKIEDRVDINGHGGSKANRPSHLAYLFELQK